MKVVILAGGLGTRLSEETHLKPKPMVDIGGKPILWHIMKTYSHHGINDFIICCGYKGYVIKEYFSNYFMHMSDVTFDLRYNKMKVHRKSAEPWKVTLVDTGEHTMTGGRLLRVKEHIGNDKNFCFTYGDGVSDIDVGRSIDFHNGHGRLATMAATYPPGRFGSVTVSDGKVSKFKEKPQGDGSFINAGYFVLNKNVFDYIKDDATIWEKAPLENLSKDDQLMAYKHMGFWRPMDTLRDKNALDHLWTNSCAPWKVWD